MGFEDYLNDPNGLLADQKKGAAPAFPGPFASDSPEMQQYDAALQQSSGAQDASPGAALSGEAPAQGAEPAFNLPMPGDEGKGVGEARKPQDQNDFFGMYRSASDEDKDHMAGQMEEQFAPFGLSLEGAVNQMWGQNPEMAAELGKKFGFVPPADQAGKPGFKTEAQALADYEEGRDRQKAAEEKARLKKEKRQAMGGFLFEMGLRILASNREDAGGAIAEGALGTIEARQARKEHSEDRTMGKEDRTRKQRFEDTAEGRAEAENRRREDKAGREQEIHEAMKEAGTLATGASGGSVAQFQYDIFKKANEGKGWTEQQMAEEYQNKVDSQKDMTKGERERAIQYWYKAVDEAGGPEGWDDWGQVEKKKWIEKNLIDSVSTPSSDLTSGGSAISFDEMN